VGEAVNGGAGTEAQKPVMTGAGTKSITPSVGWHESPTCGQLQQGLLAAGTVPRSLLTNRNSIVPRRYYHVTPARNRATILKYGIVPRAGRWLPETGTGEPHEWSPRVFLATGLMAAYEVPEPESRRSVVQARDAGGADQPTASR
jgi:hypothetical protein